MKTWTESAPSNIALIKYMGKVESAEKNRPTNTSLSFTLPHLLSYVQLELDNYSRADVWEPLREFGGKKFEPLTLSSKGSSRFLAHLDFVRKQFEFSGFFRVRSANDFPSDCGLASSASSFAALTRAVSAACGELTGRRASAQEQAQWSRMGSGSSCRSFFAPWSVWTPTDVREALPGFANLIHQVIVVDDEVKAVSSSEAHKRVTTSELFAGRPQRADRRVGEFVAAMEREEWRDAFEIAWAEFWDMHALFETSKPSFGYMTGGSLEVLNHVRSMWSREGHGPLVTMDAGPNVHLLYRNDAHGVKQAAAVAQFARARFKVFSSRTRV